MSEKRTPGSHEPVKKRASLTIVGGLILFTVVLGTTDVGYIPVPTEAKHATTMHLPTIVASLLEGWPLGFVVGGVFGLTSMYMSATPIAQDPIVAMIPRLMVGITPFLVYRLLNGQHEYVRLAAGAIVGTMTNTVLFLGFAVARGFMPLDKAAVVALVHGIPETVVAVLIVIPAVIFLRKMKDKIRSLHS